MTDAEVVLSQVVRALDSAGIGYMVVGSMASSVHGIPRLTRDIDFVAVMDERQIEPLVQALGERFYADAEMMRDALREHGMFNVIDLETLIKADVYVRLQDNRLQEEMVRAREVAVPGDTQKGFRVAGPEDTVVSKLRWYRMGGEQSDRQWSDVMGILRVRVGELDLPYLKQSAADEGVADLLTRALVESGEVRADDLSSD